MTQATLDRPPARTAVTTAPHGTGREANAPAGARMRATVAQLASVDRRTATAGEGASADWIAARLSASGVAGVELSTFRTQRSWRPVQAAYIAAGLLAARLGGVAGRLLAAGTAISYELDTSGRSQWLRRFLPAGAGTTVSGRIPPSGTPRRTLVLVAHHDAAHEAVIWHPRTVALNRWCSQRTGRTLPSHAPLLAGMLFAAFPGRRARRVAYGLLGAGGLAVAESSGNPTAPGANDNATGVAAVLELAGALVQQPLEHTEVVLVFPGGEEVGNAGMRAWMSRNRARFDRQRTLLVNLDAVGSGEHLVVSRREGLTATYAARDVRLATEAAVAEGIELREVTFPNVCDAYAGRLAGLRAISLLSYDRGWIANLHQRSDTPENVRWSTVDDAVSLVRRIARSWDAEAATR